MKQNIYQFAIIIVFALSGCNDLSQNEPEGEPEIPFTAQVATLGVDYLADKCAKLEFSVDISQEFSDRTISQGVLVSKEPTITLSNSLKGQTWYSATQTFDNFENLDKNTQYYYVAYATDGKTLVLGNVKSFKTTNEGVPSIVSTAHGAITGSGFFCRIYVRNAYLVSEAGIYLATEVEYDYNRYTRWYYSGSSIDEPCTDIDFEYGEQGHWYNKGVKVFVKGYIRPFVGSEQTTGWSYFYIP